MDRVIIFFKFSVKERLECISKFSQLAFLFMALPLSISRMELSTLTSSKIVAEHERSKHLTFYPFSSLRIWSSKIDMNFFESISKDEFQKIIIKTVPEKLKFKARALIPIAIEEAIALGIDPLWVIAVMWVESHFNPGASSYANAHGPMQILPETADHLIKALKKEGIELGHVNFYMPDVNIKLGAYFLKQLLERFGNHIHATVAYNMGPGWVSRSLKLKDPVGVKNHYFNKVLFVYRQMVLELARSKDKIMRQRSLLPAHFLDTRDILT